MKDFDSLWRYITQERPGVITVQERSELEHVYNLMQGSEDYLEVGTAEGNSLYVLGHQVKEVACVDLAESHTETPRREVIELLNNVGIKTGFWAGDSTNPNTFIKYVGQRKFDCVLIDGGHDYTTVLSDAILYAPLATKYIFFHDIQLPEVRAAVEWWHKRWQLGKYSTFINSDNFGYGIVEIGK